MKCHKCNTDNLDGAKFCRNCGSEISGGSVFTTNVMDRFPKYNFVPTNLIEWEKPWFAKIRTVLFSIIFSITFFMFCYSVASFFSYYSYVDNKYDDYYEETRYSGHVHDAFLGIYSRNSYDDETESKARFYAENNYKEDVTIGLVVFGMFSLISLLVIIFGRRKYPAKNNQLRYLADYVQKYRYTGFMQGRKTPILKFYVKDNKMGLLDVAHYCVFLPAQYDKLEWREKNKFLNATLGNKLFIVDIYGKELK